MSIAVNQRLPEHTFKTVHRGQSSDRTTGDIFAGRTVVLFAVPGAFTPTCHGRHLPGFVERLAEFKAKGVDAVACLAVNDAYVLGEWAKASSASDILFLADGAGAFAKAIGLDKDFSAFGMGLRSQRFAMIVRDGAVAHLAIEQEPGVNVSGAEAVLSAL